MASPKMSRVPIYTSYKELFFLLPIVQNGVCTIREGDGGEVEELFIFGESEI